MGFFKKLGLASKLGEGLGKAAESLGEMGKEAVVDKDKVLQLQADIEALGFQADAQARQMYEVELKESNGPAINFIRAIVRPLWGIIGALAFGFECFTIIFNWTVHLERFAGQPIPRLAYPDAVHVLLITIAGFYFGSRLLKERADGKLKEKWGI